MHNIDGSNKLPILVTGAAGFIGGHVTAALLRAGHSVRALSRKIDRRPTWLPAVDPARLNWLDGDLTNDDYRQAVVQDVSAVVHCAAMVGDQGTFEAYHLVNVEATRHLHIAAMQRGSVCKKFVHISSLGVYEARDHYGTDETIPPSSTGIDAYTATKIEAENIVSEASRRDKNSGMTTVILRPGFTYGPHDRSVLPHLALALQRGRIMYLGSGQQKLNNTGIENLTDAVQLALSRDLPSGEIFNITDARLVSKREFIGAVANALGLPEPQLSLPRFLVLGLTRAYEVYEARLKRTKSLEPLLSMARYKFMGLNLDFSIAKARRELGYEPRVDFCEGIVTACQTLGSR